MNRKRTWIALGAAALAVAVVLVALVLPAAADAVVAAPAMHRGGIGFGPGIAGDEALAKALGISVDDLQAARQSAYEAAVKQAVDEGLVTQAQADALLERGRFDLLRMMGRFVGAGDVIDQEALLADALGISIDDLRAAQQAAADAQLDQAVENGRLTQEQADMMRARQNLGTYLQEQGLGDRMRALLEEAVQGAVEAGVITQEQADAFLSNQGRFDRFEGLRGWDGLEKFDGMRGFEGHPGRGGMRGEGRMPGLPGSGSPNDETPSGLPGGGARFNGTNL